MAAPLDTGFPQRRTRLSFSGGCWAEARCGRPQVAALSSRQPTLSLTVLHKCRCCFVTRNCVCLEAAAVLHTHVPPPCLACCRRHAGGGAAGARRPARGLLARAAAVANACQLAGACAACISDSGSTGRAANASWHAASDLAQPFTQQQHWQPGQQQQQQQHRVGRRQQQHRLQSMERQQLQHCGHRQLRRDGSRTEASRERPKGPAAGATRTRARGLLRARLRRPVSAFVHLLLTSVAGRCMGLTPAVHPGRTAMHITRGMRQWCALFMLPCVRGVLHHPMFTC